MKLGGLLFKRVEHGVKKGEAMEIADYWRSRGMKARVIRSGKNYSVYLRHGRKRK